MPLFSQWNISSSFLSLIFALLLSGIVTIPQSTYAANILAVFPSVWKSHYLFGRAILQELVATQHHNVTLISAFRSVNWVNAQPAPSDTTSNNLPHCGSGHGGGCGSRLTEIQIDGIEQNWLEMGLSIQIDSMHEKSIMERFTRLVYAGASTADLVLANKEVKNLLLSNSTFDLFIVDIFLGDALLGFSQFYKAPTIVVSPTGPNTWINEMTGNSQNSALDPSNFLPYLEQMSLYERIINTLMSVFEKLTYNFFHMIAHQAVYEKHFEPFAMEKNEILPHHRDLAHNISLVLMNSHAVVQYPRSFLPNVIEVGGIHLRDEQLPEHLLKFIEESVDGVIYVSFGADVKTSDFSDQKLDILLHVLETLTDSMRILLKWEDSFDKHDFRSTNIFTSEWFPQQAILAHPKVKLFISSAGLMSVIEAIHYTTPMLAIPILPEQEVNAKRLENRGCGLNLPYEDLNYDSLLDVIASALSNKSLPTNIAATKKLLNENIQDPMSRAMYYIDMVLQTSGANHLKSHANNFGFFKTELVDVLLIILAGVCVIIAVPFLVICAILRRSDYTRTEETLSSMVRQKRSSEPTSPPPPKSPPLRRDSIQRSSSSSEK
ncbi:UDP-glycosyltransferase UGT4 [Eupeodes corollae]|uniref:UDP-glycosyltransferase UGT4 n=1 Tax=Eupeodes corollae TaxID=290404 RepID=UPI002492222F|nr:UDP-glycosyltransferase UGT4 [Eupeodes corollae]